MDILKNIIEIRKQKGLSQENIADFLKIETATYSRIESGKIQLNFNRLTDIASFFEMPLIDVLTHPKRFVDSEAVKKDQSIKACLTIELEQEKKDQILALVFGKRNLEILNKSE